jgi:quinolinate synthase
VDKVRAIDPGIQVIVHPECRMEVCQKADAVGSTERLLEIIREAPPGASFAVGTEIHLVNRMGKEFAADGKKVITLDGSGCLCTTMFRISPQHLCWVLENLVEGDVVNQLKVKNDVKRWARVALDRMLEIHSRSRDTESPSSGCSTPGKQAFATLLSASTNPLQEIPNSCSESYPL